MKIIVSLAIAACVACPVFAQSGVNVAIGVNQPGIYGRINIGDAPRPALYSAEPVIIRQPPRAVERQPVYLYVPPAHERNWSRYCGRYNACSQPVLFVREDWVRERYEHEHSNGDQGRHRGWDKNEKHNKHDRRG